MENISAESFSKSSNSEPKRRLDEPTGPKGWKILLPFAVFPLLIVSGAVGVFLLFGKLADSKIGPQEYLTRMQTGSSHQRWQAAYELSRFLATGNVGPEKGKFETELLAVLGRTQTSETLLRRYLLLAIGQVGGENSLPVLENLILKNDTAQAQDEKIYALLAIGRIGNPRGAGIVRPHLHSNDPGIRKTAAFAMGFVGDSEDIRDLKALLDDPVDDVKWNAALALAQLGNDAGTSQILSMLDWSALSNATPGLRDPERWGIVQSAMNAAGKLRLSAAREPIQKIAEAAPDPAIRETARHVAAQLTIP